MLSMSSEIGGFLCPYRVCVKLVKNIERSKEAFAVGMDFIGERLEGNRGSYISIAKNR